MPDRAMTADDKVMALATRRAIEAANGLAICSAETGKSTSQLSRCGSTEQIDSLSVRDAVTIDALGAGTLGAPFILNAMARRLGMVVIEGPGTLIEADGIQASVLEITCELGDVCASIREALADGKWSIRELHDALAQVDELNAASAKLRAGLMAELDRSMATKGAGA